MAVSILITGNPMGSHCPIVNQTPLTPLREYIRPSAHPIPGRNYLAISSKSYGIDVSLDLLHLHLALLYMRRQRGTVINRPHNLTGKLMN